MVGSADLEKTLSQDDAMLRAALAKKGTEMRVDVIGVSERPFLARMFAIGERQVAIHMHNPDHPLVVMSPPPNAAAPSDDDS